VENDIWSYEEEGSTKKKIYEEKHHKQWQTKMKKKTSNQQTRDTAVGSLLQMYRRKYKKNDSSRTNSNILLTITDGGRSLLIKPLLWKESQSHHLLFALVPTKISREKSNARLWRGFGVVRWLIFSNYNFKRQKDQKAK